MRFPFTWAHKFGELLLSRLLSSHNFPLGNDFLLRILSIIFLADNSSYFFVLLFLLLHPTKFWQKLTIEKDFSFISLATLNETVNLNFKSLVYSLFYFMQISLKSSLRKSLSVTRSSSRFNVAPSVFWFWWLGFTSSAVCDHYWRVPCLPGLINPGC